MHLDPSLVCNLYLSSQHVLCLPPRSLVTEEGPSQRGVPQPVCTPLTCRSSSILCLYSALSHSLCLPKSLKKKLTMLQETLNLPPVTSETVNRLVLERFVDPLGVVQVCMLGELLEKEHFWLWWYQWPKVSGLLRASRDVTEKQLLRQILGSGKEGQREPRGSLCMGQEHECLRCL